MSTTPTPRTDAKSHWHIYEDGFHTVSRCKPDDGEWVPIDFARHLERELKAYKQDAERLARLLYFRRNIDNYAYEEDCREALCEHEQLNQ